MGNSNRSVSVYAACTSLSPVHNDCMTHGEISERDWECLAGLGRVCLREGLYRQHPSFPHSHGKPPNL